MTRTEPPTMRINGPADLITAVPYLLGFHPQDSLVLVGTADRVLVVTARLDLADEQLLPNTIEAMVRGGTRQLLGGIYTDHIDDDDPRPGVVLDLITIEVERAGVAPSGRRSRVRGSMALAAV